MKTIRLTNFTSHSEYLLREGFYMKYNNKTYFIKGEEGLKEYEFGMETWDKISILDIDNNKTYYTGYSSGNGLRKDVMDVFNNKRI